MSYDLLLRNGTVVDGTGAPRYLADVAISDGRVAEIGKVKDGARKIIDASDLIVAPGFVDPHTHYDAQICWDPQISCSSWHGVTSVVMGNCGVGIAPCKPQAREIAAWDLVNVESIPFDVLSKGVTWDWESFPSYMTAAEKRGSAINLGFIAPLTPFRHTVMGEESMDRAATADETARIAALLREAVAGGALGFSTTIGRQHIGYRGRPLACRLASRDELKAYCNVLRDLGKGAIEISLTQNPPFMAESELELLDFLLTESQRKVTWLALFNSEAHPDASVETLNQVEPLIRRGGIPQVTCKPLIFQLNMRNPFLFGAMSCWNRVFNQTVETQKQIYRDPEFRNAFRATLKKAGGSINIMTMGHRFEVQEVGNPALKRYEGKTLADVGRERGTDGVDTLLDLAVEDDLRVNFVLPLMNADESKIPQLICDPRTMIGLSDGGAHVDQLCDAGYCTYLIGTWAREKAAMSLEYAVKRLTSEPADFFNLRGRGRIAVGNPADLAIFDFNTIGSPQRGEMRADLPGGGRRLVVPATGVQHTVVNGTVVYEDGKYTGTKPGTVLRS
ncbi:MAG TPA: amidohydrolase family protein [Candidatus Binataceae bacterium]|jgi:N-acyl-D-amino-acid deacylase|nr:amidohydrolase family protein [Candidatus Binataceae bacterium]